MFDAKKPDPERIERLKQELIAIQKWDELSRGTEAYEIGRKDRLQRLWEIIAELGLATQS